jgi:hypothetical protein
MAGVDLRTVQELLGHKDLAMTLRYAHLAPAHTASAVEKLGAALAAPLATSAAVAVGGEATSAPERFRHAVSGRQTAAKRAYVESRDVTKWRRGESNTATEYKAGDDGIRDRVVARLRCSRGLPSPTAVWAPGAHANPQQSSVSRRCLPEAHLKAVNGKKRAVDGNKRFGRLREEALRDLPTLDTSN